MQLDQRELCQMFSEVSFIAARYGMADESDVLNGEIDRTYPGTETPCINKGFALLCRGKAEESYGCFLKFFDAKSEQDETPSDLFYSFFALSMVECGYKTKAAKLLNEVIERNEDVDAVDMARGLLPYTS